MYIIRLRNFAVSLEGDARNILRDDLETAIHDTLITLKAGPNRSGLITDTTVRENEGKVLSFYSKDGSEIAYTDYRCSSPEERLGTVGEDIDAESQRLCLGPPGSET